MVAGRVASNGGQGRIVINPEPRRIARELKKLGDGLPKELKRLHQRLGDVPVQEIRRRARALGGGMSRIAEASRAAAQAKGVVVRAGGARFPDFAGWEFGAGGGFRRVSAPVFGQEPAGSYLKRTTRQFRAWRGNGEGAGYVIHPIMRDEPFMNRFGEQYVDELDAFLGAVFRDR